MGWVSAVWPNAFRLKDVLDPLVDRGKTAEAIGRLGHAAMAWGSLGTVTTTIAIWRLRPAYLRQMEARPRRRWAAQFVARPRPVRDIIAWKEYHVGRRVPLWLGVPLTVAAAAALTAYTFDNRFGSPSLARVSLYSSFSGWAMFVATLIVGVRCSGSITGERERHTWDGLMTSPLSAREIVRGKLRGVLRATWPYLLAYWFGAGLMGTLLMIDSPDLTILSIAPAIAFCGVLIWWATTADRSRSTSYAVGWFVLCGVLLTAGVGGWEGAVIAGVALLASWLAMHFLGAVGLACSARSVSSWRSLLATVVIGYVGGSALFCAGIPIGCVGSMILAVVFEAFEKTLIGNPNGGSAFGAGGWFYVLYSVSLTAGSAGLLWLVARSVLNSAENTVAKRDRIPPDWVRMIEMDLPRYRRDGDRPRLPN